MITRRVLALVLACFVLLEAKADGLAAGDSGAPDVETGLGEALPDAYLSLLRGGFINDEGLRFAFAFDRVTRLNGEALSRVSVVLPVFNLVGDGLSGAGVHTRNAASIAGSGPGSFSSNWADLSATAIFSMPLLLQNSLDNQHIENLTLINLDISGTQTLRGGRIHNLIETTSILSLKP